MSRNLGTTSCHACPAGAPTLVEEPRPITEEDCGGYFDEYRGMIVANAECAQCGAKYLAWVDWSRYSGHCSNPVRADGTREYPYTDLSYRDSFDDEPSIHDLPLYEVRCIVTYERVRTIRRCPNGMDLDREDHVTCRLCAWDERIALAGERGEWGVWYVYPWKGRTMARPYYNDGPWPTEAEAEARAEWHHRSRLGYYKERPAGPRPSRENILVRQWTPELAIVGRYHHRAPRGGTS